MKSEYVFHWASVSKTFVATSVMQLAEKGSIDINKKLIDCLPEFKQKGQTYKDITIREMLNHTSGIGDVEDYQWDHPENDAQAGERYVKSLYNDTMLFAPGKDWAYSNTAFDILGVVITKISGMPFEDYVKKNILLPLGMNSSSFIYPEIPESLRVSGHTSKEIIKVCNVYPYNRRHAPSSTLNSTVLDMSRYSMAHLNRGMYKGVRILQDSSYHLLWENSVHLDGKPKVGMSWFLRQYKGIKTVSHSGGDTGFASFLLLALDNNISVQIVSNYDEVKIGYLADAILDFLLGQIPEKIQKH